MANIGYARVSTVEQNLDLQLEALKTAGCTRIFKDKASGATMERCELEKALDRLEEGDTLTVWKMDRLGRNTKALLQLMDDLNNRGVTFRSLTEGVQTTGAMGKHFSTMLAAFAEMERELIRERTLAGMATAKAKGVRFGSPVPEHLDAEAKRVMTLAAKGLTRKEIAAVLGVSVATVYRRQAYARSLL